MDITKLKISNTIYKLKDSTARDEIDKLKNNTISITEQNLTNEQKQQVLENLGISIDNNVDTSSFQTADQVKALIIDQVSELIANQDTDFDTLKEISAWLTEHKASAAQMNLAIQDKVDKSDVTNVVESGNTNPVTSGAVKSELDTNYYNKQSVDANFVTVESLNGYTPLYIQDIDGDSLETFIINLSVWVRDNTTNAFILKGSWSNHYHYVAYGVRNADDLNFVVSMDNNTYTCFYIYGIDRKIYRLQQTAL